MSGDFHLLFLHGPPAAGKFTVGEQLSKRLGWPLFHNHLGVDAAFGLFEFGTPEFVALRATFWREGFAAAARARRSFIFTFNPERSVDPALVDELCGLMRTAGGAVHFVALKCDEATVRARLASEGRRRFRKLRDLSLYDAAVAAGEFVWPALPEPLITLDTTHTEPDVAAAAIAEALRRAGVHA